jgi:phosphatidylinositol phospholipase C delta
MAPDVTASVADLRARIATTVLSGVPRPRPRHRRPPVDEEELGLAIDSSTVAGGGHHAQALFAARSELRVSHALRSFLVEEEAVPAPEASLDTPNNVTTQGALLRLLTTPHLVVPPELTDRSHPLPEYYVSSSHNTYLIAHQLYGASSAQAYETAMSTGARCLEIDAWDSEDNADEPKVTHGYTLVSNVPFRTVCETIRDVVDREAARPGGRPSPVVISLENHCGPRGQLRLVAIMREVWGHRLLSSAVRRKGHAEQAAAERGDGDGDGAISDPTAVYDPASHVSLQDLGAKIVVIVEYHFPNGTQHDTSSESSSDDDDNEAAAAAAAAYEEKKKQQAAESAVIVPELAELGVYAQSVKPVDDSWFASELRSAPHHHLINVSESGLAAHMPLARAKIGQHNARHLMRVYPKGTRISSRNLHPVVFWAAGAQICALNWQSFDAALQLNEALFWGTDGYVLKPAALRPGGSGQLDRAFARRRRLRMHVAGASDVPLPADKTASDFRPYITCNLIHPTLTEPVKRKTRSYHQHRLAFLHRTNPPTTDPFWNETLEWDYDDNEMVFLRILLKNDESFARNPKVAVATVRLLYLEGVTGWRFIDMLNLKGGRTQCSLLVKFEMVDL